MPRLNDLARLASSTSPARRNPASVAGLRSGELQALQVEDVDLTAGVLQVRQGWDKREGFVAPKYNSVRVVPICETLRGYLATLEGSSGFAFGASAFNYGKATRRAYKAWKDAGLARVTLHECRHSFSSYLDAGGVWPTNADRYMGHKDSSVAGRYRHQFPGQLAADAEALEAYLGGECKVVALSA